ncbi:MAG TPA: alanine dehydrogenase [Mariprofundaceae bacterium]|nr:alanine dehydrogenase [Mariprofundaceae bacterium]
MPKEIKDHEFRVGMTPAGVDALRHDGHIVRIQRGAGIGSGLSDEAYEAAGAEMVDAEDAWSVDLVVKVKEPLPQEYGFLRPGLTLFTFLHLAAMPELADVLLERKVRAVGYETVEKGGRLPLLAPMSQVAGKVAAQKGTVLLHRGREENSRGLLLGGVPGTERGRVVIIGGGNVGLSAAKVAAGLDAHVIVMDRDPARLAYIDDLFGGKVETRAASLHALSCLLSDCDMLIGAALVAGARAPQLLSREMLRTMRPGSVFLDVAIDQGGMAETSRPTSHSEPTFEEEGVIHYCVANMPGAVPATSTAALTQATLPFVQQLAQCSTVEEIQADHALAAGVNTWDGKLTCRAVAEALQRSFAPLR